MLRRLIRKYPQQVDVALLILGFTLGANYFALLRISGLWEIAADFSLADMGFHWSTPTVAGLLMGTSMSWLEFRVLPRLLWGRPRYQKVPLRMVTFFLAILLNAVLVLVGTGVIIYGHPLAQSVALAQNFIFSTFFVTLLVFLMLLGITLSFLRAVSSRFGPGILINYILGHYQEPREEYRVFMFVDLNGSTRLAEQLGHTRYSRFLNKCFSDLSSLLVAYDAEIYQYVGDEAVITWSDHHLRDRTQPIRLFFAFEDLLRQHRADYLNKFGQSPTFKASVHAGSVIVTELGVHRKELAYHGDVLNTAARMLELCSRQGKWLLVTTSFAEALTDHPEWTVALVANLVLRGKYDRTAVYSVARSDHSPSPSGWVARQEVTEPASSGDGGV